MASERPSSLHTQGLLVGSANSAWCASALAGALDLLSVRSATPLC